MRPAATGPQRRFHIPWRTLVLLLLLAGAGGLLAWVWRDSLSRLGSAGYALMVSPQRMAHWVADQGTRAPLVFILLQIAQVILAPVPGEATGFVGGLLFGTGAGFAYSTVGLTIGSWINLALGRLLGRGFVRRVVAGHHLARFDALMQDKGLLAALALFVLPGFPKDYLCLFLGLSRLPLRVLLPVAAVGRMPGTFLLSLQGDSLADGNFVIFGAVTLVCGLGLLLAYRRRDRWQRRLARMGTDRAAGATDEVSQRPAED